MWTRQTTDTVRKDHVFLMSAERLEELRGRRYSEIERRPQGTGVDKVSCTSWSLVKSVGFNIKVMRLKCKRWDCKRCGPKRQKQLQWLARSGVPNKFLTLTASQESGSTPDEQAQKLRSALRTLRRKAKKLLGSTKIEFLAVFEQTKKGTPHLHIMMRCKYIRQKWISDLMNKLTSSPIVDIRRIKNKRQAALYVSKYIAKNPTRFQGCKRYWRSMEFSLTKRPGEKEKNEFSPVWKMVRQSPEVVIGALKKMGYRYLEIEKEMFCSWYGRGSPPYPAVLEC